MAKKTKKDSKSESYKEFTFKAGDYDFTGRLYTDFESEHGKVTVTPLSITIDDLLSIKGCSLKQTEENTWIEFPKYKNKDGDYISYVFVDKDQNAFNDLAEYLTEI